MAGLIRIGTRPSRLALRQAEEVRERLGAINTQIVSIETKGDRDKASSLFDKDNSDFFTYEIEQALLSGAIDAAVHSAKDMEKKQPQGLVIAALTRSLSLFECLVSCGNVTLEKLASGSLVGTSSQKRKEALLHLRPDLVVRGIRGDIEERLRQLDDGEFDAVIIAHAALIRIGLENRITQIIASEIIPPHPLQGRLAIQIRRDRDDLLSIFKEFR